MSDLVLELGRSRPPTQPLFTFGEDEILNVFEAAARSLQPPGDTVLYQSRHGGASHDGACGRSHEFIRIRGRWEVVASCARYAKPARYLRIASAVPADVKVSHAGRLHKLIGKLSVSL